VVPGLLEETVSVRSRMLNSLRLESDKVILNLISASSPHSSPL